jgi:RNA polymerase primary sigma factor
MTRLLSAAEEVELAKRIEDGDARAKDRMIESNLGLVVAVASTYRHAGVPFADLVQEGNIGLMRAVERFDHRRGLKLSTYAVWWIRRSMLDAIGNANVIRVPARARQQLAAVRRVEAELRRAGVSQASDTVVAARAELSVTTVRALRTTARVTTSLDDSLGDGLASLGDLVPDERAPDPSEPIIARERRRELVTMLQMLPERHREVLVRRYGLDEQPVQSHQEIGARLGVGTERSRQIERAALHRLRMIASTTRFAEEPEPWNCAA